MTNAAIEGLNISDFLQTPWGLGEQIMINMASNVYILKYLKAIGQDTPEVQQHAIRNIENGKGVFVCKK